MKFPKKFGKCVCICVGGGGGWGVRSGGGVDNFLKKSVDKIKRRKETKLIFLIFSFVAIIVFDTALIVKFRLSPV